MGVIVDNGFGSYDAVYAVCSNPSCGKNFKVSHWDTKKAQRDGWFLQKDGSKWCPQHIPSWVAEWRAKQKENQ
jgi:hypothetical protein